MGALLPFDVQRTTILATELPEHHSKPPNRPNPRKHGTPYRSEHTSQEKGLK